MIVFQKSNSGRMSQQKFMRKKGNIYFVNTANIENTVNTANNKNNIVIIYLTLQIGFFIAGRIHTTNRFSKHTG